MNHFAYLASHTMAVHQNPSSFKQSSKSDHDGHGFELPQRPKDTSAKDTSTKQTSAKDDNPKARAYDSNSPGRANKDDIAVATDQISQEAMADDDQAYSENTDIVDVFPKLQNLLSANYVKMNKLANSLADGATSSPTDLSMIDLKGLLDPELLSALSNGDLNLDMDALASLQQILAQFSPNPQSMDGLGTIDGSGIDQLALQASLNPELVEALTELQSKLSELQTFINDGHSVDTSDGTSAPMSAAIDAIERVADLLNDAKALQPNGQLGAMLVQSQSAGKLNEPLINTNQNGVKSGDLAANINQNTAQITQGQQSALNGQGAEQNQSDQNQNGQANLVDKLGASFDKVDVIESKSFNAVAPTLHTNSSNLVDAIARSQGPNSVGAIEKIDAIQDMAQPKVLNTLKLQLKPAELGMVTAVMRLQGDMLQVDLRVENAEAFRQLNDDSSAITKALKGQGYAIEQVNVQLSLSGDKGQSQQNQQNQLGQQGQQNGQSFQLQSDANQMRQSENGADQRNLARQAEGGGDDQDDSGADLPIHDHGNNQRDGMYL